MRYCDYWAEGYLPGAPSPEAEEIDTQVAEGYPCPCCGSGCHYEGWHKEGSYIALSVCDECGYEEEF